MYLLFIKKNSDNYKKLSLLKSVLFIFSFLFFLTENSYSQSLYNRPFSKDNQSKIKSVKYANGDQYVGTFKDDKIEGQGTFTYANGDQYVGAFKDDKIEGQGTYSYANGNEYVGAFKGGKIEGQGTYTYANGDKYVGAFKDNKRDGHGTFTYANGDKYVGAFKDDKYDGHGKMFEKDNDSQSETENRCIYQANNLIKKFETESEFSTALELARMWSPYIDQIEKENELLKNQQLCVICLDQDKTQLFNKCKHICTCAGCAKIIMEGSKECPICRTKTETTEQVYF